MSSVTLQANEHDAMLRILTFSLIGCRDASLGKLVQVAKAEYRFAKTVHACVARDGAEREGLVLEAIREYRSCNYPEVPDRADMYAHLLSTCKGEPKTESNLTASPRSAALLQLLTLGMSRLSHALDEEDLEWAAIEGDHIHNIPSMLDVFEQSNLSYYLEKERSLFLDRIAGRSDLSPATSDWQTLCDAWRVLQRETRSAAGE